MALTTLTVDEATDLVCAIVRSEMPDIDVSRGTDDWNRARAVATLFVGNQEQALYLLRQAFASQAEGEWLALWGKVLAAERLAASKASGKAAFTASSAGLTQPSGSVITLPDGTEYTMTEPRVSTTPTFTGKTVGAGSSRTRIVVLPNTTNMLVDQLMTIGSHTRAIKEVLAGEFAVDVYEPFPTAPAAATAISVATGFVAVLEAIDAGAGGNKEPGETATMQSPTAGVTAAGRVCELTGGGNEETTEEQQARFGALQAFRPGSGNAETYRALARQTPNVRLADAFVFTATRSLGSVDIVPFGLPGARMVGDVAIAQVAAYLTGKVSFADDVLVRSWEYESADTDVELTIEPHTGYEPDITATGDITTYSSGTVSSLVLAATPTSLGIQIGDRITVNILLTSGRYQLCQRTVIGMAGSTIYLDENLPATPTTGSIYPGGPLVDDIQAAVEALFDGLGVGGEDAATPLTRHPSSGIAYPSALSVAAIVTAVSQVTGLRGAVVANPTVTQEPGSYKRLRLGQLKISWA